MPTIKNISLAAVTKLFKVMRLEIEFGKGILRDYEVIAGNGRGAVMILPIMDDYVFFIKEYSAAIDDYCLTFPKGKIDEGEDVLTAANRELQEEIGLKSQQMNHVYTLDLAPGYIDHKTHIVIAQELFASKLQGDEPEELEVCKCKLLEVQSFLATHSNIDSRVFSALYIYSNLKHYVQS